MVTVPARMTFFARKALNCYSLSIGSVFNYKLKHLPAQDILF